LAGRGTAQPKCPPHDCLQPFLAFTCTAPVGSSADHRYCRGSSTLSEVFTLRAMSSCWASASGRLLPLAAFSVTETPMAHHCTTNRSDLLSGTGNHRSLPRQRYATCSIDLTYRTCYLLRSIEPASALRQPPTSTFSATTAYRVKTPPANRAASQRCGKITPADFQRTETPQKLRLSARGESLHQTLAWAPYPQIPRELHAPTP
jgi:hypothetical protein